jgi:hypothetical protein
MEKKIASSTITTTATTMIMINVVVFTHPPHPGVV